MASTYSTNLKIELIGTGEQAGTWGTTTNTNLGTALEQAIVGKADVAMSSTTVTLTLTNSNAAQDARAIYLNLTGSPGGAAVLEVPAVEKPYIVKNGSDQQVTVKVSGQTGVAVPTGKTMWLYNNGTDVTNAIDNLPSGATVGGVAIGTTSGTVTSVDVSGGTTGLTTSGGPVTSSGTITIAGTLAVANGGTGITSFGAGVATALGVNTGSAGAFVVNGGALGTPSSGTLTNATGLPIATGVSGLGTNVATALAVNVGSSGAFVTNGGALGTPSSGTLSSCTVDGTNEVGFRNVPAVGTKTTSYTLQTADVGKYVQIGSGGSITIPDATFSEGDAVSLFNNTAGDITVTCTITTAYVAGTDSDVASVTLATRGICTIFFISGTVCVITGNV